MSKFQFFSTAGGVRTVGPTDAGYDFHWSLMGTENRDRKDRMPSSSAAPVLGFSPLSVKKLHGVPFMKVLEIQRVDERTVNKTCCFSS